MIKFPAPGKFQHFPEFDALSAGSSAIAVASGTHVAVVINAERFCLERRADKNRFALIPPHPSLTLGRSE